MCGGFDQPAPIVTRSILRGIWKMALVLREGNADTFILKNVMIPDPHLLHPENTLEEAMVPMSNSKLGCIPIVVAIDCQSELSPGSYHQILFTPCVIQP